MCPVPQGSLVTLLFSRLRIPLLEDCKRSALLVNLVYVSISKFPFQSSKPKGRPRSGRSRSGPSWALRFRGVPWNPGLEARGQASSQRKEGKSSLHVGVWEGRGGERGLQFLRSLTLVPTALPPASHLPRPRPSQRRPKPFHGDVERKQKKSCLGLFPSHPLQVFRVPAGQDGV